MTWDVQSVNCKGFLVALICNYPQSCMLFIWSYLYKLYLKNERIYSFFQNTVNLVTMPSDDITLAYLYFSNDKTKWSFVAIDGRNKNRKIRFYEFFFISTFIFNQKRPQPAFYFPFNYWRGFCPHSSVEMLFQSIWSFFIYGKRNGP